MGVLVAVSVLGHVGVLAILTANHAQFRRYEGSPVFEVSMAPRVVATPQVVAHRRPLLRPRPSRSRPDDLSVA
ncbi:hypothetical protein, partial [Phenylobacterium sp.]|uniref:hypothetical protein n=1 Tax=Phenylobacterium sp. TaxID=1871053 RepID=UPI0030F46C48